MEGRAEFRAEAIRASMPAVLDSTFAASCCVDFAKFVSSRSIREESPTNVRFSELANSVANEARNLSRAARVAASERFWLLRICCKAAITVACWGTVVALLTAFSPTLSATATTAAAGTTGFGGGAPFPFNVTAAGMLARIAEAAVKPFATTVTARPGVTAEPCVSAGRTGGKTGARTGGETDVVMVAWAVGVATFGRDRTAMGGTGATAASVCSFEVISDATVAGAGAEAPAGRAPEAGVGGGTGGGPEPLLASRRSAASRKGEGAEGGPEVGIDVEASAGVCTAAGAVGAAGAAASTAGVGGWAAGASTSAAAVDGGSVSGLKPRRCTAVG
mmetsp:Transcript_16299/g.41555  ORF Transcript_16299/g.41555 Transcript_16299/m.41555 type:complete len:333 (+) Transcript_16299:1336-2334(+)